MVILEVRNIAKRFGSTQVLKNINFTLEEGEVLAIIGSSGSGKTTLLRCLNFLLQVIKRITAPMSNEIITLVKDTALARVIMVVEIIKVAETFAATRAMVWPLFYTGAFYLLFVGILTLLFGYIEKRLSYFRA